MSELTNELVNILTMPRRYSPKDPKKLDKYEIQSSPLLDVVVRLLMNKAVHKEELVILSFACR